MLLFFQIQNLQLLIFFRNGQDFLAIFFLFFYVLFCNIIKVKYFFYPFIILLHSISSFLRTRPLLVPFAYPFIIFYKFILMFFKTSYNNFLNRLSFGLFFLFQFIILKFKFSFYCIIFCVSCFFIFIVVDF